MGDPIGHRAARRMGDRRLGTVRRFAQYCSAIDPRTIVPPPDLLPYRYQRPTPYIYRDEEITRLLDAARQLPSATGLRPHTYATLFGFYVATGCGAANLCSSIAMMSIS